MLAFVAVVVLSDAFDAPLYALFGWRVRLVPGVPVARLPLLVVFAAAALLLAGNLRSAREHVRAAWLLWPAVALAFLSAIWSDRPGLTLLWASALLGTSAFGVALAVRFSAAAQASLVASAVASIAAGSVVARFLWPIHALAPGGQWRGLYVQKNLLGRVLALGVSAALVTASGGRQRSRATVALLLCGGILLATQSRASVLAALVTAVAAILLVAARRWRHHAKSILASGAAVAILAVVFLVATPSGLALMSRSQTLSERTTIWKAVAATALEAPWVGHGYAAFWQGPAADKALVRIGSRRKIEHAHNGALDVFAELGAVGLVLVLVPLGIFGTAALRHALEPGARACLWPATYLVFFVASNAGESAFLRHKLYWALYVAAACHVAKPRRSLRRPAVRLLSRT